MIIMFNKKADNETHFYKIFLKSPLIDNNNVYINLITHSRVEKIDNSDI